MGAEILVVDDEESLRQLLKHYLNAAGYDITLCEGGREATDQFDAGFEPDLAICDVMMPRLDGRELLRMIRNDELDIDSDLPVILLTSRGREEHVLEGFKRGADDYVTKPFRMEELLARVRRHVDAED